MRCPFCGHDDSQVKDSRPSEDNSAIRRRRHCPECGGRFTTFERVQLRELIVVKKNGRREAFDRDKLERSINHALRKRPVERERVDRMITGIVRRLESMGENEIPANMIGELVMQALASLDKVAYVRFASVYRNFRETRDFETLIGELEGDGSPLNVLIVEARYHAYIADALMDGATMETGKRRRRFRPRRGLRRLGDSRRHRHGGARPPPLGRLYRAKGTVVRGPGFNFEIVAGESAHGLMHLSVEHGLCIGNGIIAADDEEQAYALAVEFGGEAARACLALLTLRGRLGIHDAD